MLGAHERPRRRSETYAAQGSDVRNDADETFSVKLCSGMGGSVRFFKPFSRHMRINLSRRKIFVTEKFLNAAQIRAAVKHVCRKRMSKHMRRDVFSQSDSARVF